MIQMAFSIALSAFAVQDDPAKLIEQLGGEGIEERDAAQQELKKLGESVRAELERAAKSENAEVAARAAFLVQILDVRKGLTENLLKAMPDVVGRLARGEWAEVFLEAIGQDEDGKLRFPGLREEDLARIAERALETTAEEATILAVLKGIRRRDFRNLRWKPVVDLLKDRRMDVPASAARALVELWANEAVPELLTLLKDTDGGVRALAACVLGDLRVREAAPKLVTLLQDAKAEVRDAAVVALWELGAGDAAPEVLKLLKDEDAGVRSSAAKALGDLRAKEAVLEIVRILKDEDAHVRGSAAMALMKLGAKEAAPEIVKLLKDEEAGVRSRAARALGELGAKETAPKVVDLLKDRDSFVRQAAGLTLVKLGVKEVAPEIVKLLNNGDPDVRIFATETLGELGAVEAAPELLPLLKDGSVWVRRRAATSLALLGSRAGVDLLLEEAGSDLEALNALRRPEEWSRIRGTTLTQNVEGAVTEVRARLEKASGLTVDAVAVKSVEEGCYVHAGMTLHAALVRTYDTSAFSLILEEDRIRLVPRSEALALWKRWWAEEQKKK